MKWVNLLSELFILFSDTTLMYCSDLFQGFKEPCGNNCFNWSFKTYGDRKTFSFSQV